MSRKHQMKANETKQSKTGLTRREFLTDCALPTMTAFTLSPILDGLFQHTNANAEGDPSGGWVRTVHLHLEGGWGFWGTFVGQTPSGDIISRATMVNHGIANGFDTDGNPVTAGIVTSMGAPLYSASVSSFTAGLLETLSAAAVAQVRIVKYAARSTDDNTSANQSGIMPLATFAGMSGLIAAAAGDKNSPSGNETSPLAADPSSQRLSVNNAGDVINASAFSRQLSTYRPRLLDQLATSIARLSASRSAKVKGDNAQRFQDASSIAINEFVDKLNPAVTADNLNPARDTDIQPVYGLTLNSPTATVAAQAINRDDPNNANSLAVQATMVKAALDGNLGPIAFSLSRYDYHDTALNVTNARNRSAGQFVARILQAAFNKNVTTAVWLTTDGGLSHNTAFTGAAGDNQSQYSGDREAYSGAALFVMFAGTPPQQNLAQVGSLDVNSGVLVRTTATGELRMASAHAFWNIALLSNKASQAEASLAAAGYSRTEIDTIKGMTVLFSA